MLWVCSAASQELKANKLAKILYFLKWQLYLKFGAGRM